MFDLKDILFAPLEVPSPPPMNLNALDKLGYNEMYRDDFRNCYHVNLMTAQLKKTAFFGLIPELASWLESEILTRFAGRIMIIVTPPMEKNRLHIDCSPAKFKTLQHKFRFVLQGSTDSLVFQFKNGKLKAPNVKKPFIMDGKWPHFMFNNSPMRKYTLAIGYPCEPDLNDRAYSSLLEDSFQKNRDTTLFRPPQAKLPDSWKALFDPKYLGQEAPDWHKEI